MVPVAVVSRLQAHETWSLCWSTQSENAFQTIDSDDSATMENIGCARRCHAKIFQQVTNGLLKGISLNQCQVVWLSWAPRMVHGVAPCGMHLDDAIVHHHDILQCVSQVFLCNWSQDHAARPDKEKDR